MLVQTLKHLGPSQQQKETFSAAAKTQKNSGLFVRQNFTTEIIAAINLDYYTAITGLVYNVNCGNPRASVNSSDLLVKKTYFNATVDDLMTGTVLNQPRPVD